MDWMMRNMCLVLAQSVSYIFPSDDVNFSCTQIGDNSIWRNSLYLIFNQYCLGVGLSVNASITSTTEKYHSFSCQTLRIFLSWNTTRALSLSMVIWLLSRFIYHAQVDVQWGVQSFIVSKRTSRWWFWDDGALRGDCEDNPSRSLIA